MEFYHHSTVHFGPVHIINALHVYQVLVLALYAQHLLITILILALIVQMLMNGNVL